MRVMVLLKANADTEAGVLPSTDLLNAMGAYNEQLVKAGIMLAGEGLRDSSHGKRVRFADAGNVILDGPFAETKELVSGFWIWQVASMDEAVEWIQRAPFGDGAELELRPISEYEDFGDELTPELREREQALRDQVERNQVEREQVEREQVDARQQ